MARLSLRQAAERFDVSRPTLSKALKAGTLTGERDDATGAWLVDASELARLYRPRTAPAETAEVEAPPATAELAELRTALELERAKREAAERLADERGRHIEDLRRMLPAPTVAAPSHDSGAVTPRRRTWWPSSWRGG